MENTNNTADVLARYEEKRKERSSRQPDPQAGAQLTSYLQAAAVLHCFNPDSLQPLQTEYRYDQVRLLLFDHIVKAPGGIEDRLFSLKTAVRQQTLKEMGTRQAMARALEANPARIQTDLQQFFENYVHTGEVQPLPAHMTYQQLVLYCQLLTWLDGLDPRLISLKEATVRMQQKSVLASFEHLVDKSFTGRQRELGLLRDYITGNEEDGTKKPIFSVCGAGGIGKSALVANLLMEIALGASNTRIPFAYIPFDQPTLRIESPFTILLEVIAQLELQLPQHKNFIEVVRQLVRDYRDGQSNIKMRGISYTRDERIGNSLAINMTLYQQFGSFLRKIAREHNTVFLLVLDTFEEVEYRDKESLNDFWAMLETISDVFPGFRIIIAGRTSIRDLHYNKESVEECRLEHLDLPDSISLLINLGVHERTAGSVAGQIGGNPLSLRLAANLITTMKARHLDLNMDDIMDAGPLQFELDEQLVQGQLYNRILDHIHEDDVRTLAHPGMVLRVTSPLLILHVLAPACALNVHNLDQATTLFEKLKKEHALVRMGPESTLIYRPEVREAMIRLLKQDKPEQVHAIHQAAIEYYEMLDDTTSRAEEMYHRLALGEDDPFTLNSRWIEDIESSVVENLSEYSNPMKAWLASHISLEVDRSVFEDASTMEWEQNTNRKVQKLLTRGDTVRALKLLAEREERSKASPLFALEAKALVLQKKFAEAAAVLNRGIKTVSQSDNRGRLAELFWLLAQVAITQGKYKEADELLERAEKAIAKSSKPIAVMHVLCHRLLIIDTYGPANPGKKQVLRARLNQACERLDLNYNTLEAFVVKMAMYYLEQEYPKTFNHLGEFEDMQIPDGNMLTSENLRGLDEYRDDLEQGDQFESYESLV
jgi:tetratricopeptide (TPR) repeat protein